MTNIISFVHTIFDNVNKFIYILVGIFILIIITYGTGIKNSKFLSLILKVTIVGMYFYLFVMNYTLDKYFELHLIEVPNTIDCQVMHFDLNHLYKY